LINLFSRESSGPFSDPSANIDILVNGPDGCRFEQRGVGNQFHAFATDR
jgi:hypothetical protein